MRGHYTFLRSLLQRCSQTPQSISSSSHLLKNLVSVPKTISLAPEIPIKSLFTVASVSVFTQFDLSNSSRQCRRSFCSPSGGPSNIVLVKSEEDFNNFLSKVEDGSLPAIFYFTAVWCGPCRFISPILGELSGKYPHVTTYKIDIDQAGLESTLRKLNITSVPTLHFFQGGKKAAEIIGADLARLKNTMETLYKKD